MNAFTTINPATQAAIETYPLMDEKAITFRLDECEKARRAWVKYSRIKQFEALNALMQALKQQSQDLARLITNEMGKPVTQAQAEVQKCALLCEYYLKNAEQYLAQTAIRSPFSQSFRCIEPTGILLGIMPWNFPLWQVFRYTIPNILLGNGILLKHAPNVTGCAVAIENLMNEAGFPPYLFNSLIVDVDTIPSIIHDSRVQGVTLTGSQRAGRAVAKEAGAALKKVVLELGGNDPYLILDDADLELASSACVQSRLMNAGQVCIAAKRILVHKTRKADFEALVLEKMQAYVMGNPLEESTLLGPMARDDLRQAIHAQTQATIGAGGRCVAGGSPREGTGFYYPATCLVDVPVNSVAFKEELFGPVLCITEVQSEQHAIELANQTQFGLGAAVFSQDLPRAKQVASALQAGLCAINTAVASDPSLPFGGVKSSGFGRELAMEGMHEFANIKTLIIK